MQINKPTQNKKNNAVFLYREKWNNLRKTGEQKREQTNPMHIGPENLGRQI